MNIKSTLRKILPIILAFTLIFSSTSTLASSETQYNLKEDIEFLEKLVEFIKHYYAYEVTDKELMEGAFKGLFSSLDDYSNYYTEEEFKDLTEALAGEFGGVGIVITEKEDFIMVVSTIEGAPGFKAGIKPEDLIISVNDLDIKGLTASKVTKLIRGEPGTQVKLGIKREGEEKVLYFTLTRETIELNPVEYNILDNNIGYIKITDFNKNALENVMEAVTEFEQKKIDKVIFDLRNNPGGGLDDVLHILRLIVTEGPLVHIKDFKGDLRTYYSYMKTPRYKLAVLVNEGSASASEIFAGAVQDRGVGTIIGTNTFGKGTVQTIFPLVNGAGIKITTAEYFTPNMNPVNKVGIKPDIVVENTTEEDLQMKKAIEILK